MRAKSVKKLIQIILIAAGFIFINNASSAIIPVSGFSPAQTEINTHNFDLTSVQPDLVSIDQFISNIVDGQSDSIQGVYTDSVFALKVVQQPSNNAGYVSSANETVTQFNLAKKYDTIGLLAHNTAAGQYFFEVAGGKIINVIYGDGTIAQYQVKEVYQYQALSPNSATSNFIDLETGETYSAAEVFYQMYTGDPHLTLQTCIERDSIDTWGRLFILAYPL